MSKKKIRIGIIAFLGLICIITGTILLILPPKIDTSGYTLIDNLKIEVYSNLKIKDLLKSIDGKLLTNSKVNTEKLGKQELTFTYEKNDGKKRRGIIDIEVVDEEEPLVWLSSSYTARVGSDLNLEEEIFCADNYDSNPNCKIEGTYDLNTAGTYNLTYVATDSSDNEEKIDFILNVYDPAPVQETQEKETVVEEQAPVVTAFNSVVETHKDDNTEIGIDVSRWQGEIDFSKVAAAGATFVMIRVGAQEGVDGKYNIDPYFKQNIENAIANDLKVGVYFYSYADSIKEAKKQANWVLKQIQGYKISLPIAFDWECYDSFNQMELSLFGLNEVAESFLETVEDAGYDGMLYGSKSYLNSIWRYHEYDVWLAHYTDQTDYDSHYVMWQLCQDGQIDGINTAVDINVLYKNEKGDGK